MLSWHNGALVEQRSYTSRVIAESTASAESPSSDTPLGVAALEAAATLYSSAFAVATLEPDVPALTSEVRGLMARNLIRLGQDYHELEIVNGKIRATPCGYAYPYSDSPHPEDWLYQSSVYTPSGSRHRWIMAGAMLHTRYSVDSERPWIGLPAWRWAHVSSSMIAYLTKRLTEEVSAVTGRVVPLPAAMTGAGDTDKLNQFRTDFKDAAGKALFLPTTQDGGGEGRVAAPSRDWVQSRIGAAPPDALVTLRSDASEALLTACGVPLALARLPQLSPDFDEFGR